MQQRVGFREASVNALQDENLQAALGNARGGFVEKRQAAIEALPEFAALKQRAKTVKNHTLEHLGHYLETFEQSLQAAGGQVHWARDTEEANRIVLEICAQAGARRVTKGKSMISEEMHLNAALEGAGHEVIEADLGE